jgi:hypothetical protein
MTPTPEPRIVPKEPTEDEIFRAALVWCGRKERETSPEDITYFKANWRHLPGLKQVVDELIFGASPSLTKPMESAVSARELLVEAAALFREYESHHRAKVERLGDTIEREEGDRKAERNAAIADKIERALSLRPEGEEGRPVLYVQFSDDGKHLRKWSRTPFAQGIEFDAERGGKCSCMEVYGEDPNCIKHGRGTDWSKANPDICELAERAALASRPTPAEMPDVAAIKRALESGLEYAIDAANDLKPGSDVLPGIMGNIRRIEAAIEAATALERMSGVGR